MIDDHLQIETRACPPTGLGKGAVPSPEEGARNFRNAVRVQDGLVSGLERTTLLWLAARIPGWVSPDHLTLLGLTSMFLAGGSYALARRHPIGLLLATSFLALNWFGDSLDGTIARVRRCERPRYGFYVDHMIDAFGTVVLMAGLAASSYIDWRVALSMLVAFQLLSIESYLASYTLGIFRLVFVRFGPTEIRILLALANTASWLNPNTTAFGLPYRLFDFGGAIAALAMTVAAIVAALRHTATLYRQESRFNP